MTTPEERMANLAAQNEKLADMCMLLAEMLDETLKVVETIMPNMENVMRGRAILGKVKELMGGWNAAARQ